MHSITKICIFAGLLFMLMPFIGYAQIDNPQPVELAAAPKQERALFQGEINDNNINIRSDSTVSSKTICVMKKGEQVEVVKESYEWYKIKLPKTAPSFIKKDLTAIIDEKTAKVIKDNVNIRLFPETSSAILGKAGKDEVVNITGENRQWYKIEPVNNSFGWVNKKFVNKADAVKIGEAVKSTQKIEKQSESSITIEGIIKPYGKVINRVATHKLFALDNKILLLKGNKDNLDSLIYHKVRITGKSIPSKSQKYSTIEIQKIEALN